MTADEIRSLLARKCQEAGGQAEWGRQNGFDRRYINDVLTGRRELGPDLLAVLGARKVTVYEINRPTP